MIVPKENCLTLLNTLNISRWKKKDFHRRISFVRVFHVDRSKFSTRNTVDSAALKLTYYSMIKLLYLGERKEPLSCKLYLQMFRR